MKTTQILLMASILFGAGPIISYAEMHLSGSNNNSTPQTKSNQSNNDNSNDSPTDSSDTSLDGSNQNQHDNNGEQHPPYYPPYNPPQPTPVSQNHVETNIMVKVV